MPPGTSQPRTLSFAAGSTTTTTGTAAPQNTAIAYPPQPNTNTVPVTTQPQSQPQQQKLPAQLSAAQQRLQAIRQQQQQQAAMQQSQAPPATSSNQYSLRSRRKLFKLKILHKIFDCLANQSRYVDVLASTTGAVAPTPNISLNDLIPTPSSGMPTFASSNQTNNYFVPG